MYICIYQESFSNIQYHKICQNSVHYQLHVNKLGMVSPTCLHLIGSYNRKRLSSRVGLNKKNYWNYSILTKQYLN